MAYDLGIAQDPVAAHIDASSACARLDERIARSPVRGGFLKRCHLTDVDDSFRYRSENSIKVSLCLLISKVMLSD